MRRLSLSSSLRHDSLRISWRIFSTVFVLSVHFEKLARSCRGRLLKKSGCGGIIPFGQFSQQSKKSTILKLFVPIIQRMNEVSHWQTYLAHGSLNQPSLTRVFAQSLIAGSRLAFWGWAAWECGSRLVVISHLSSSFQFTRSINNDRVMLWGHFSCLFLEQT